MRCFRTAFVLLAGLLPVLLSGQTTPQHGVQTGDIDRKANPCTDFFQYANGTWRAENPIPAFMPRWSRRWQAGEDAKGQLKEILDDVSKRIDWPKGSPEQLIGDYYGSCMDQAKVDKLGLAPAQPILAQIDAIKTPADLQRMIRQLQSLSVSAPFGMGSTPDNHNPGQTIATVFATGLGLPDRDYYLKPDQRFADAREKYRAHVTRMFELAGHGRAAAKKASDGIFYLDRAGIAPADLNVDQPEYMGAVDKELKSTPLSTWKVYLEWNVLNAAARHLAAPIASEDFAFYGKYLRGATEMKPRWKRCVEADDALLGEALGRRYVERYFPAEAKARMQEMVKNLLSAMGDTIQGLQWMSPQTKQQALRKLSTF